MADEIIEELWSIKDEIAKEADYDIDKLIDLLRERPEHGESKAANHSGGENFPCLDDVTFPMR